MNSPWAQAQIFSKILAERIRSDWADHFYGPGPVVLVRAPARLDLMGGVARWCGAPVCQTTLGCAAHVAAQARNDGLFRLLAADDEPSAGGSACWPVESLYRDGRLRRLDEFLEALATERCPWTRQVAAAAHVLVRDVLGSTPLGGASILVTSDIPNQAGLAAAAAVETATVRALSAAMRLSVDSVRQVRLAAEANGAPLQTADHLGIMFARPETIVVASGSSPRVQEYISLPVGVRALGVDSGVRTTDRTKHQRTRVAALMGHRLILACMQAEGAADDPMPGHLANLDPQEYTAKFRDRIPTKMKGREFLETWGPTGDPPSCIEPDYVYRVRSRTEHHIYEHGRVERFIELIRAAAGGAQAAESLQAAGRLMYASHWSYGQRCGLGTIETDYLVNLIRQAGPEVGLYGARISDNGAGGTVAVLCQTGPHTDRALREVFEAYQAKTGRRARLLGGSLPGVEACGEQFIEV